MESFQTTNDLLDLINDQDRDSEIENTQKLCHLFGAILSIQTLELQIDRNHNEHDKESTKRQRTKIRDILNETDSVLTATVDAKQNNNDNEEENENKDQFPMNSYLPIMALIQFQSLLMLNDEDRIREWIHNNINTECPQIDGIKMNIVHFETALGFLLKFGSFADESRKYENAILLIQHILDLIDDDIESESMENEQNITLDVFCDFIRFIRLLISYQLKLTPFDETQSG